MRSAIEQFKEAATNAECNFRNKIKLLEAEQKSLTKTQNYREVIKLYDESITSAKNGKLIHEQGLACEKAALYFRRENDVQNALKYFNQAKQCYEEWGSTTRVNFIQQQIDSLISACQSSHGNGAPSTSARTKSGRWWD